MEGQERIQVNFQIPASALEGLSRLTEQLRLLAEAFQNRAEIPGAPIRERGENTAFDLAKFQAMDVAGSLPDPAAPLERMARTELPAPTPNRGTVSVKLPQPDTAARTVGQLMEDPAPAGSSSTGSGDTGTAALPALQPVEDAQAVQSAVSTALEDALPAGPGDMGQPSSPHPARADAESPLPNAPSAGVPAWAQSAPPTVVQTEMSMGAAVPTQVEPAFAAAPDTPPNRWGGLPEEVSLPTPLPLTAEAVSQAFQRDGRRYDSGFPLY